MSDDIISQSSKIVGIDMVKKKSSELDAMTDNEFLTYYHGQLSTETYLLDREKAFDNEIHIFDISTSHPQPLCSSDITTRNAIFTAYGRTPPS